MSHKKFDIGEEVRFDPETNTHYRAHMGHVGKVVSIDTYPKVGGPGTVVVYEMACECGRKLHPQASHIELAR
jgi:hypothetical protein